MLNVCFTEIKEKFAAQKADVGPPTACQRYAIEMAYRWWPFMARRCVLAGMETL